MGTTLILIGIGCIIGAIIGGGVKLVQIELSQVTSLWRQGLLGVFGVVLIVWGVMSGGQSSAPERSTSGPTAATPAASQPSDGSGGSEADRPRLPDIEQAAEPRSRSTETQPPVRETAALPSKVDIFWCEAGGTAAQSRAQQVADALQMTGEVPRIRVRPLSQATNAQPDYGIAQNIARFDPGERSAAARLATIATAATGASFSAAPALPGSPSLDYISIFVCAPN